MTNGCQAGLVLARRRHDTIQEALVVALRKLGHQVTTTPRDPSSELIPDIVVGSTRPPTIIDIAVAFDDNEAMARRHQDKCDKYRELGGTVLPFNVGALGSWKQKNGNIREALDIPCRTWNALRRRCRSAAIRGTTDMIVDHLDPASVEN